MADRTLREAIESADPNPKYAAEIERAVREWLRERPPSDAEVERLVVSIGDAWNYGFDSEDLLDIAHVALLAARDTAWTT